MPAHPHDDIANHDLNDGNGVRYNALRIHCGCGLPRLITSQEFSAPAIELRRKYPDLPRNCRDVHTRLRGLLDRCGLELVRPEPAQLSWRAVKMVGHRLDYPHQSKASRRSRHRSSHSEKSYARNTPPSISSAGMGSPCRLRKNELRAISNRATVQGLGSGVSRGVQGRLTTQMDSDLHGSRFRCRIVGRITSALRFPARGGRPDAGGGRLLSARRL